MPPAYDICFTHIGNATWKWPIEAKLLHSQGAVAEYLKDVRQKYLAGVAAPLVGEGGMAGYLLKGHEDRVFDKLKNELGQELAKVPVFIARSHRATVHVRTSAPQIRIHHLVMRMGASPWDLDDGIWEPCDLVNGQTTISYMSDSITEMDFEGPPDDGASADGSVTGQSVGGQGGEGT